MRFKGTIVIVGVVGLLATIGCTETKKPASDQKPPEVTFGDQKKGNEPSAQPQVGGVPKRPAAATPAEPADGNPGKADKAASDTLELPGATSAAVPASPATAPADRSAPGAETIGDLRTGLAAATDENGRVLAVDALADLGPNAHPALDDLVKALGDDNIRLRWHAARAIGRIGEGAFPVLPKLVELLRDADPIVVTQAAAAIREIRAATMYELGPVVQPAYPSTSVSVAMRSFQAWLAGQGTPETTPHEVGPDIAAASMRLRAARLRSFMRGNTSR